VAPFGRRERRAERVDDKPPMALQPEPTFQSAACRGFADGAGSLPITDRHPVSSARQMAALGPHHLCAAMFDEFGEAVRERGAVSSASRGIRHECIARADRPDRHDGQKQCHGPTPYHVGPELPGFAFPPLARVPGAAFGLYSPEFPAQQGLLVITIRHSVVLGIVLCVSSAGTLAQNQDYEALAKVLAAGDPNVEALAKHRLTVQNVRQMFAVDRELLELMNMVPDLETRIVELHRRFDPRGRAGSAAVDVDAKVYEAIPEIAQILQRQKMSGREYWLTKMQAVVAAMWDEVLTPEALQTDVGRELAKDMMTPALKFWKSMAPGLKAEADEWKKAQGLANRGRGGVMR
jgi:hypothetical protein